MGVVYNSRIVTDGLVLCLDAANRRSYPGSGTVWTDLSGNANHGTLTNGPTFSGANGGNIVLDGADDYISITENANMRPQTLTAEIGVKINSTSNTNSGPATTQYIMFRQNSRSANFEGYVITYDETAQKYSCGATPSGGSPQYSVSTVNTYSIGQICFISAIFDSTTMSLYVNGAFQNSGTKASGIDYNNTHTLKIGRTIAIGNGWDASTNGTIYFARIYNRILSASEIRQNYNATKGRYL